MKVIGSTTHQDHADSYDSNKLPVAACVYKVF